MNSINDCYLYCGDIARKQYSGSISNDEFNRFAVAAQQLHLLVRLGLEEEYKIMSGYPSQGARKSTQIIREAAQELEASMANSDAIKPFLASTPTPLIGVNNVFTVPADFVRYRSGSYKYTYQVFDQATQQWKTDWRLVPIEFVTGLEYDYRLYQYVKAPSLEYPIIIYDNDNLLVRADVKGDVIIPSINLKYVRLPKDPFRNATPNTNDQSIYNPVGSIDFEFPKMEWIQISNRIIEYWAQSIRDKEMGGDTGIAIRTGQNG